MAEAVLSIQNIVVRYGEAEVVSVPEMSVREGEILAIIGPNGAGKSTLLRVLGFLEPPTEGEVIFQGQKVQYRPSELLPLHRRTAVVFQDSLLLDMTVFENVALGLKLRGVKTRTKRVDQWLARFGISHLRDRRAKSLSGGEAQRASLARAFVLEPEVLLLDEPFSSLDPPSREALLADLKSILVETRTTTVFVTHDRDEALILGNRVAVMILGQISQIDSPERIFSSPANEEIARFVGVETILPGRVFSAEEGLVTVEIGDRKVEVIGEADLGEQVLVCVRPEEIVLSKDVLGSSSMRNCLEGEVVRTILLGPSCRIVADCGGPVVALITKQSYEKMDLKVNERVVASFKATAAHLIRKEPKT